MKKFTEEEKMVINFTLKSLLTVVHQEIKSFNGVGVDVTQEVRATVVIKNILEKINK